MELESRNFTSKEPQVADPCTRLSHEFGWMQGGLSKEPPTGLRSPAPEYLPPNNFIYNERTLLIVGGLQHYETIALRVAMLVLSCAMRGSAGILSRSVEDIPITVSPHASFNSSKGSYYLRRIAQCSNRINPYIIARSGDLKGLINSFHPVCVGLQENFLSSNNPLKLRGYNSVRRDAATGSNHSGVVCILTSNLYPSTPLILHTSLQAVAIQVHARTLVTVCSVCLPPHDVISQQDLDTLVDQFPTPFLFLGDFNRLCGFCRITEAVQIVAHCLTNSASNTIPKCSPRLRKFRRPWWNEDCCDSRREEKRLWNIFKRYPTTENHVAFKRAKALARCIRRRSQRESWINFISSIPSSTSSKQLWIKVKTANGIYREFSFPVLNRGNVTHSAPLDIANTLGHAFEKVSATDSYSPDFVANKNRAERTPLRFTARSTLPYNSEFRMFELETALSRAHDTSPGSDRIAYNMLRHLNTTSLSHLLFLFNRIWTEKKYPSQWHEAIVIPILKPGKDPSNPLHYRPIDLTNCLFIFDRKLTFLPHVLHLRKKCERSLNIPKGFSETCLGADRTSLLRIYKAVTLSRIDYRCTVYGSSRPTVLRRLDTIHHSALQICTGAFRTSPVEIQYIISHQLPLDSRRPKISALYSFRAQSVRKHPINQLLLPAGLLSLYAVRPSHILPLCERTNQTASA
ncbi:hypothetical protein AVEN_239574-1 [Araneus ventricosus]|uniref:Endonuclease/exonuclease/phosphatase domain-containing protein n=1 Tax=Araneus ventricosus TaxID=182803 RepID=A0A4Y2TIZ8_ARAVE|nr:hypothetical protein AVEN_239574-1 [Araneus ventricosus]